MRFIKILLIPILLLGFFSLFSFTLAQQGTKNPENPKNSDGTQETNTQAVEINPCLNGVGKDCFKYEEIIGINNSTKYSATSIAKDIIYAATYMVGAVLTAVIIWCGLGYIFAARDGRDTKSYQKGLINGIIGAIIVIGSYTIVRLIQYIAKG